MASATSTASNVRHWRLILMGETGKGKSSVGNSILGREFFETGSQPESLTAECSTGSCHKYLDDDMNRELKIYVTDTIGLFDTQCDQDTVIQRIGEQIFKLTSPGPHAILIVCRIDRFTSHEEETINLIKSMFGPDAVKYCIFIFTYEDQLRHGQTIHNWINQSGRLGTLMNQYHNRYLSINNKNITEEKIKELTQMIDTMITENGNEYYTNTEYQRIEKLRKLEKRQKEQEEKAKRFETERLHREKQDLEQRLENERLRRERAEEKAASQNQQSSNEHKESFLDKILPFVIDAFGKIVTSKFDNREKTPNKHAQESSPELKQQTDSLETLTMRNRQRFDDLNKRVKVFNQHKDLFSD